MTTAAMLELARRIAGLEDRVNQKVSQLAYSSIEDGAITEYGSDDAPVASYGQQFDGSHMAMPFTGVPPLQPTPATVREVPGGLVVAWDGFWVDDGIVPTDFSRVEVHACDTPDDPADTALTLFGTIETPRGAEVPIQLDPGTTKYVRLVARNLAGGRGTPSAPVAGTAGTVPQTYLSADAIDGLVITGSTLRTDDTGGRLQMRPGLSSLGYGNGIFEIFSGNSSEAHPGEIYVISDGPNPTDNISLYIQAPEKVGYTSDRPFIQMFAKDADSISSMILYSQVSGLRGSTQSRLDVATAGVATPNDSYVVTSGLQVARVGGTDRFSLTGSAASFGVDVGTTGQMSANNQLYTVIFSSAAFSSAGAYSGAEASLPGGTFVAPSSGRVRVVVGGFTRALTTNNRTALAYELRAGAVLRSGTVIQGYSGFNAIGNYGTEWVIGERMSYVGGLTPGATYNIAPYFSTDAGGGACSSLSILVEGLL